MKTLQGTFKVQLNRKTSEIQLFDNALYHNAGTTTEEMEKSIDVWYAIYPPEIWREVFFSVESMELLLKEFDLLQLEIREPQIK